MNDAFGTPINVGSVIAFAQTTGRSAVEMFKGTVTEIKGKQIVVKPDNPRVIPWRLYKSEEGTMRLHQMARVVVLAGK